MSAMGNITRRSLRSFVRRLLGRASARTARGIAFENVEARRLMSAVTGSVYSDGSHFGYRDPYEVGLGGQTVYADANYNNQLDPGEKSTVSAANGSYTLDNLPLSPFSLRVKPSGDYTQTKPQDNLGYYVGVQNGALVPTGTEFGVFTGVVIRGQVFNDANGNGVRDPGESGSASAAVYADYDNDGFGDDSATVNADGTYALFAKRQNFSLFAFAYNGLSVTTPKQNVTITNGTPSTTTANFGIRATTTPTTTTVIGTLFVDKNHNGVRDAGEPGLATGSVFLSDGQNNRGYGDVYPDGTFAIGNVNGTGPVQVIVQTSQKLAPSNPGLGQYRTITLNPGNVVNAGDFAFDDRAADVILSAFDDKNNNGQKDAGEGSVFGLFWVDLNGDNVLQDNEPSSNGRLTLPSGTYRIAAQLEGHTGSIRSADTFKMVTVDGVSGADVNVAFARGTVVTPPPPTTTNVSGTVFNDANNNGKRDAGENGQSGVVVYADYNYNGVLDADDARGTTDANGAYSFSTAARPFALRTALTAGQTQTAPASNGVYYYEVRNGAVVGYGSTFGVVTSVQPTTTTLSGYVYEDVNENGKRDAGENGVASYLDDYSAGYENPSVLLDLNGNGVYDASAGDQLLKVDPATGFFSFTVASNHSYTLRPVYDTSLFRPTSPGGYGPQGALTVAVGTQPVTTAAIGLTTSGGTIAADASTVDTNNDGYPDGGTGPGWVDLDRDGVLDANEPLLTLGNTPFTPGPFPESHLGGVKLPFGTYRIAVDGYTTDGIAEAYVDVTISADKPSDFESITVPHPQPTGTTIVANVTDSATKSGVAGQTVFADYNYNGVLDAGEDSAVTSASGGASLHVQAKPFQLVLKPASGYAQSSPANNGVYYYEVKNGVPTGYGSTFTVTKTTVTPPTTGTSRISLNYFADFDSDGKKTAGVDGGYSPGFSPFSDNANAPFIDINRNGAFDAGDRAMSIETYTGGDYGYYFGDLAAGTYRIVLGGGLQAGESVTGGSTRDVTVQSATDAQLDVPISGVKYAQLTSNIFFDTNRDGYQQAGEFNATADDNTTGVVAYVDLNYDGVRQDNEPTLGLSDHYGHSSGIGLLPGSYSIRVEQNGKPATFAYGATSRWVTLSKPGVYTTQLGIVSGS